MYRRNLLKEQLWRITAQERSKIKRLQHNLVKHPSVPLCCKLFVSALSEAAVPILLFPPLAALVPLRMWQHPKLPLQEPLTNRSSGNKGEAEPAWRNHQYSRTHREHKPRVASPTNYWFYSFTTWLGEIMSRSKSKVFKDTCLREDNTYLVLMKN